MVEWKSLKNNKTSKKVMENKHNYKVAFANHSYSFYRFQDQYKGSCEKISNGDMFKVLDSLKIAMALFSEYSIYISNKLLKDEFKEYLENLKEKIVEDKEYEKLKKIPNKTISERIIYYRVYYSYIIKILKFIGNFGDELTKSFFPNKTDRRKILTYSQDNPFFEAFTIYKATISLKLCNFDIRSFRDTFTPFMGFYYAYYLYVDEKSRVICEQSFSNILNIYLNQEVLKLVFEDIKILSSDKRVLLKDYDIKLNSALNSIFFRMNYSYSNYGIIPKKREVVLYDRTTL